jgi:hypothetical protein
MRNLSTETVEGTALALEGVDNIEGGDSLACGRVSKRVQGKNVELTHAWRAQCR